MGLKCVTPNDKSLRLDTKKKIGSGGFGYVFKGKYNGQEVAVKRILLEDVNNSREETALQSLDQENVVKLYHHRDDENFRYFVFELCATDLKAFCRAKGKYKGLGKIPSDVEVLLQLATGLEYIHSMKIIHRDIKPGNILISKTNPVVMKWADLGLSKPTNSRGSASLSGFRGTECWVAPEILRRRPLRASIQSDIFSTGCVFFYFLTRGLHPFGKNIDVNNNILRDNPVDFHALPDSSFAKTMIIKMIAHKSEDRISLAEIINILRDCLTSGNSLEDAHNVDLPTTIQSQAVVDIIPLTPQSSQSTIPVAERPKIKKPKITNEKKENIISIAELFLEKRKKPRWAIKARVTKKSSTYFQERYKGSELVQGKKMFFVMLEDGSGKSIKARACSYKLVKKFFSKFQEGKEYLIKKSGFDKSGEEPVLSLLGKTEIISL